MKVANLIFPHQLFARHELFDSKADTYLIEEQLFFKQFAFHRSKLAFHRASMKAFEEHLMSQSVPVHYVNFDDQRSDIRLLIKALAAAGVAKIRFIDPSDNWLEKRIRQAADTHGLRCDEYESPLFLNTRADLESFFRQDKQSFFQTTFYQQQRKARQILLDVNGQPVGGKWSFDQENRKKYPRKLAPPQVTSPADNTHWEEAVAYVKHGFADNPGGLSEQPIYPLTHDNSEAWLQQFLQQRFHDFGSYEDAIVKDEVFLNHSVLSPLLNAGLITPQRVVDAAIDYASQHEIPINSLEGFVRQLIGWREFIRGMYEVKGSYARTRNYWNFKRKMPLSFYSGTTGIAPFDHTIRKVLRTGYCHHIERLMVLGNFMLLCEIDPDEVYRWFMELFIDAYDWVMVPNVYGMSQFADGGLFATKPYISGSNYLMKMSDYSKGEWQATWDGLFWRFMHVHRDFFLQNPRLGMLIRTFDKMDQDKRARHLAVAESYLETIDSA
jgi:deoxyribodipyrimidine photolyase-related protein